MNPRARGFTLIELMVVVSLVAVASAVATMSLRDPAAAQLDREAVRLAALLESGRAHARMMGVAVHWQPRNSQSGIELAPGTDFAFVGLPAALEFPQRWLGPGVQAEVVGARVATLGPEPVVGAQRILLSLDNQRLSLVTDGLSAFKVEPEDDVR
jgi:general secretion pathway protein H